MSITSRLSKATQTLSPLQRAILVLQALREGREPDPELRRIDDEVQRRAFNRYMALLWIANHHLGAIAAITSYRVELAEKAAHYCELFNEAAGLIDEEHGLKPEKGSRNWRGKKAVSVPAFLRSLALEARDDAVQHTEHLWKETLSLERVWADLGEEFAGEDIVLPEFRQQATETQARLRAVAAKVGLRRLPSEPEAEMLQSYERTFADAFEQLGFGGDYL